MTSFRENNGDCFKDTVIFFFFFFTTNQRKCIPSSPSFWALTCQSAEEGREGRGG